MRTLTQYLLPHKLISVIADLSANCKILVIKNYLINYFIKRYAVNMSEAIETNPFAYDCYNSFFTRALKPNARPIANTTNSIVSPADGLIAQIGVIQQQRIIQAKGHDFTVQELLGGDIELSNKFTNGNFVTVYLAPKDYHRVHMPLDGKLIQMQYVPGKLFSVNAHAAENIPGLFARNERVVSIFETTAGPMAVILVGAMIVGSIETVWAGAITPPHFKVVNNWDYSQTENPVILNKGAEMGRFKLGSTVIVLFANNKATWDANLKIDMPVKMGQQIGTCSYT